MEVPTKTIIVGDRDTQSVMTPLLMKKVVAVGIAVKLEC
jgi:hypothetical protein